MTDLLGKPDGAAARSCRRWRRAASTPSYGPSSTRRPAPCSPSGSPGAASQLLGDTAHRLVPATDRDAAELIRSIRTAPLLFGWRGSAPVDTAALEELLLRVSRLVDDHPEVVAVTLEPVVVATARPDRARRLRPRSPRPPARDDLGPRGRLPSY